MNGWHTNYSLTTSESVFFVFVYALRVQCTDAYTHTRDVNEKQRRGDREGATHGCAV